MSYHCIVSSTISRGLRDDGRQNDVDKPQSVTQAMSAYVACPTDDNATVRALIAPRPPNIDINESSGVLPSITRPALKFQRTLFQVPLRGSDNLFRAMPRCSFKFRHQLQRLIYPAYTHTYPEL